MKRWICYVAALALLGVSPFHRLDISRLAPVETVWLGQQGGLVCIETDQGYFGSGEDVASALENLNATASAIVFLETADYVILESGMERCLIQAERIFRPSCMLCIADQMPDLKAATDFLQIHEPAVTLRQWNVQQCSLPRLIATDGRFAWQDG